MDDADADPSNELEMPIACANGQIAEWNGALWICGDDDNTTYTAGAGLLLTGTRLAVDFTQVAFFTQSHSLTSTARLKYFQQEFALTPSFAYDWEFFTIDDDHYLAVANHFSESSYNTDSMIYRWDGTDFFPYQATPTSGAADWEFFSIRDTHYLAVANQRNDSSYNIDSMIYRWGGRGQRPALHLYQLGLGGQVLPHLLTRTNQC
ncbi:MAG: hypothetical protein JXA37_12795 [Chloroflexia bacterium]|nr:hypothetical protein [Chloroflexia bacterium]